MLPAVSGLAELLTVT